MFKYLSVVCAAIVLAACGPQSQGGASGSMDQQGSINHDSGMNPWLAGALGFFAGRVMSPSAAPAAAPQVQQTIIQRRTIVINRNEPASSKATSPAAVPTPAPPPAVAKPEVPAAKPNYAQTPAYKPTAPPRVTYSQSFSRPSTPSRR